MTQAFRAQAASGEIRAAGICCGVRTILPGQGEKTDAMCIGLEHQSGQSVSVFLPYKKGWFGRIQDWWGRVTGVRLDGTAVRDEDLALLSGFLQLRGVSLAETRIRTLAWFT